MNRWPLVGRERELAAVVDSQDGHSGAVIFGVAGIGKSRLAREAADLLSRWGPAVWIRPGPLAAGLLTNAGGGQPRAVVVDDAHLLDAASAALLREFTAQGKIFAVLTVRCGMAVTDSVTGMWSDELVARVDLQALDGASMRMLLRAVIGRLDAVSEQMLIQKCAGNPLLLRELLYAGQATGTLHQQHGLWRWNGEKYVTKRLDDVIRARLGEMDPGLLNLVELLAIAGRLPVPLLETIVGHCAADQAERRQLILIEQSGERLSARLSYPMHADVLRMTTPLSRQRRVWRELVQTLEATPMRRRDDTVTIAEWRMRACLETPPEVLIRGAQQAMDRLDFVLAGQLAAVAGGQGGSPAADLLVAEVSAYHGHDEAAAAALPAREPIEEGLSGRWLGVRWQLQSRETSSPAMSRQSDVDPVTEAARSWFLLLDGEVAEALKVATGALDSPGMTAASTNWAITAKMVANGLLGREQRVPSAHAVRKDVHPWGPTQVAGAECVALLASGKLNLAAQVADHGHADAVALVAGLGPGADPLVGTWCALQGMVARAQGRARPAIAALTEAAVSLDRWPAFGFRRLCYAELAAAHALAGDIDQAREWLGLVDAEVTPAGTGRLLEVWVTRDRAWVTAATGDLAGAAKTAVHAADLAAATGQPAVEVLALYDAARFGAGAAVKCRLRRLAQSMANPAVHALLDAVVTVQGDIAEAAKLTRSAARLAECGYLLYAAETLTAAHAAYARAGHRAPAQASLLHATDLVQACAGARSHRLQPTWALTPLTPRELQVAALAAAGQSSAKVAAQLGLSVRTVDNYLGRVYVKLGIAGRKQLSPTSLSPTRRPASRPTAVRRTDIQSP